MGANFVSIFTVPFRISVLESARCIASAALKLAAVRKGFLLSNLDTGSNYIRTTSEYKHVKLWKDYMDTYT